MAIPAHVQTYPLTYYIDSVDCSTFIQAKPRPVFESKLTYELDTLKFRWYDSAQMASPTAWEDIEIYHGADIIFGGKITRVADVTAGAESPVVMYDIFCTDWGIMTQKARANLRLVSVTDRDIVQEIFAAELPEYGTETYVGGGEMVFAERSYGRRTIYLIMQELCETTGCSWYIDASKEVHYFTEYSEESPFNISDDPDNVTTFNYARNTLKQAHEGGDVRNRIYVYGGEELQTGKIGQAFDGNNENRYYTLAYKPDELSGTVDGISFTAGTAQAQSFDDYMALLDTDNKLLSFASTAVPSVGTANISVAYTYTLPVAVRMRSWSSYEFYSNTWFDHVVTDNTITSKSQARLLASRLLEEYAYERISGTFTCYKPGLRAGQLLHLHSDSLGIDEDYLIQSVRLQAYSLWYFEVFVTFGVFNPTLLSMLQQIKRNAAGDSSYVDDEVLREFLGLTSSFTLAATGTVTGQEAPDEADNAGLLTGAVTVTPLSGDYTWGIAVTPTRWGFGTWK